MGSKLKGTGVEFPDGTLQTTSSPIEKTIQRSDGEMSFTWREFYDFDANVVKKFNSGIGMSKDGKYILLPHRNSQWDSSNVAKNLYISSNYGKDFKQIKVDTPGYVFRTTKVSSTGQYMLVNAIKGDIDSSGVLTGSNSTGIGYSYWYESTDYGETWTQAAAGGDRQYTSGNWHPYSGFGAISRNGLSRLSVTYQNWSDVSSNPPGESDFAVSIRHDYGSNETSNFTPSLPIQLIVGTGISNDGQIAFIANYNNNQAFLITTNGGVTWTKIDNTTINSASTQVYAACMNEDGSKIFVLMGSNSQKLCLSTDQGATWTELIDFNTSTSNPMGPIYAPSIDCSDDGQNIVVANIGYSGGRGAVSISEDGGLNWTHNDVPSPIEGANFNGYGWYNSLVITNDLSKIVLNAVHGMLISTDIYRTDILGSNVRFEGGITIGYGASNESHVYSGGNIKYSPTYNKFEFFGENKKVTISPDTGFVDNKLLYYQASQIKSSETDISFLTEIDTRVTTVENQELDTRVTTLESNIEKTVIFYKSGTWVKPAGVKYFEVILVGGGGGGGASSISTDLPDTNGGRSIFFPTEDLPYHEEGMNIAEGGLGGSSNATGGTETHPDLAAPGSASCAGEAGYLGEPGSVFYQFNAPNNYTYGYKTGETTLQPFIDQNGNVTLVDVLYTNYYTGGGQGGKCYINNIKGGVGEVYPKFESPTGTGRYTANNKNSSSARLDSWSGGGGATAYYLYTNNSTTDPDNLYADGEYWHHWRGGDGGQGTISIASEYTPDGYKLEKSLAGLGHGWELVSNWGIESFEISTDTSRYLPYNPNTGFHLQGGMGFLGGGGASLTAPFQAAYPYYGLTNYNGGGGGGPGAGGGAPGGGKGGSAGEVKSFSVSTNSDEKEYTVVIGKGGNGGWINLNGNNWRLMSGGGGGAQGICIIKY